MTQPPSYWDDIAEQFGSDRQSATWRVYMQQCYTTLARQWFTNAPTGRTLKTDLFEEAVTPHHLFGQLGTNVVGMDVSHAVVRQASRRLRAEHAEAAASPPAKAPLLIVADARLLPWASHSMARILSGSSLDHFADAGDIRVALAELARCLQPGGCLVVTFDNPHNPLVWLRNTLPFGWLSRIGLVPYFVGATYTRHDAKRVLTALGLVVTDVGAMAHAPRAPAMWASDWCARKHPGVSSRLLRLLTRFDRWLGNSPLRFRTGYYLAVRAEKPSRAET